MDKYTAHRALKNTLLIMAALCLCACSEHSQTSPHPQPSHAVASQDSVLAYRVNPSVQRIQMFWKDAHNRSYRTLSGLSQQHPLAFAMNGGMFDANFAPKGLYIERGIEVKSLDVGSGEGNFYLPPNGVFYIKKDNRAGIVSTQEYQNQSPNLAKEIEYATQSGPMLVHQFAINPLFDPQSRNLNIRNGVGIFPNGELLFLISKQPVNFHAFAQSFLDAGCVAALYLDGFVSQVYWPAVGDFPNEQTFGVMIGVLNQKE